MAKKGLKTHSSELHDEIPSKNRYYKALKQLKDGGLIEKPLVLEIFTFTPLLDQLYIKKCLLK